MLRFYCKCIKCLRCQSLLFSLEQETNVTGGTTGPTIHMPWPDVVSGRFITHTVKHVIRGPKVVETPCHPQTKSQNVQAICPVVGRATARQPNSFVRLYNILYTDKSRPFIPFARLYLDIKINMLGVLKPFLDRQIINQWSKACFNWRTNMGRHFKNWRQRTFGTKDSWSH